MSNTPHRFTSAIKMGVAVVATIALSSCSNGGHLAHSDHPHEREPEKVVYDIDQEQQNRVDQYTALANMYESTDATTSAHEFEIFGRQMSEFFTACEQVYKASTPVQQKALAYAVQSLFKNPAANSYALENFASGVCGATPVSPLGR